jgi:hypothetical protein
MQRARVATGGRPKARFVLGIRAREENIPDLARSLRDLGGDPLVDVDEKLTGLQPRS